MDMGMFQDTAPVALTGIDCVLGDLFGGHRLSGIVLTGDVDHGEAPPRLCIFKQSRIYIGVTVLISLVEVTMPVVGSMYFLFFGQIVDNIIRRIDLIDTVNI